MQRVFNKHSRFEPEVLQVVGDATQRVEVEQRWLDKNVGEPGCLNIVRRATGNIHVSSETRNKMSANRKGKKLNLSDEERQRRREAVVCAQTPEAIEKMRASLTGRHLSIEHRGTLSERSARKGKSPHEALRAGIVKANKARVGETRSPEVRQRISEVLRLKVWVCNAEGMVTRVFPYDLPRLQAEGWQRGRKYRVDPSHRA